MISLPYILLVFCLGLLAYAYYYGEEARTKQQIRYTAIGIFVVFFGFRGFILSDWIIYYQFFKECEWRDIYDYNFITSKGFEPGFTILTLFCKSIVDNFHFYTFILCIINTILLVRFFDKYSNNIPLALMLYVVFEGLGISTNLMRNSIAIFIFLNALEFINDRKPIPYFLLCILATTFHISSIIFFPLYFILHRSASKWGFLAIFLLSNIVFLSHFSFIEIVFGLLGIDDSVSMKVRAYTEIYDKSAQISIGYIERLMTGILVFLYYDELKKKREGNIIFINLILAYISTYLFLSEFEILAKRICTLFACGYWIIWADLINTFAITNNRRLFASFVFLYCIIRINNLTQLPDFEYDNLLTGIKSYNERLYIHNKTFDGP